MGLAWAVLVVLSLAAARADLRDGNDLVREARAQGDPLGDIAVTQLRLARTSLARGHRSLQSPVLAPAILVPVLGRQVVAVRALSGAAVTAIDAGIEALLPARALVDKPLTTTAARADTARQLAELAATASATLAKLDLGPRHGLLGPVARASDDFARQLARVQDGLVRSAAGARAVATLLDAPHHYLVFGSNNAEMRAGSGMLLSIGEMDTGPDGFRLGEMRPVTDFIPIPVGAAPLDPELRDRWGWLNPNRDWRNLMLSPRFDEQAALAARLWEATGHAHVDGVLAVDPVALQGLMTATGPVTVDGRTIGPADVVKELTHDQYLRFPPSEANAERRDVLGRLARGVFDAVSSGGSVRTLGKGLGPVVDGRHLMAWAARPAEQADWQAAGVAGTLTPQSLLVGVLNRAGNKLDPFLTVDAQLALARAGKDTDVTLDLNITNTVTDAEPTYIAGPADGSGVGRNVYTGFVSVSMPGAAREGRVDGASLLSVDGPDGPSQVVAVPVTVERGQTVTVVVRFRLPGSSGAMTVEPSARVPPVSWTAGKLRWTDAAPFSLRWG